MNKSKEPVLTQEIVNSILKPKSLIELATERERIDSESEESESESEETEESESETDEPVFVKTEPKYENDQ